MYQIRADQCNIRSPGSRTTPPPRTTIVTMNSLALHVLSAAFVASLYLPVLCFAQTISAFDSLSILFLGDRGRHQSFLRAQEFIPVMALRGIGITYTENLGDLNAVTLAKYDGLIVYAEQVEIKPEQEKALLDYVASGRGFIPVHCAIDFVNSPNYGMLIGAQFRYHSTGKFRARAVNADHPIMPGVVEFDTWDETYVHTKPNQNCTVLQVRREGERDEPVTWVRSHGEGRVFYTAYGHDERTWNNPAFQSLMERGIRWSCGSNNVLDSSRERDRQ